MPIDLKSQTLAFYVDPSCEHTVTIVLEAASRRVEEMRADRATMLANELGVVVGALQLKIGYCLIALVRFLHRLNGGTAIKRLQYI